MMDMYAPEPCEMPQVAPSAMTPVVPLRDYLEDCLRHALWSQEPFDEVLGSLPMWTR